MVLVKGRNAWQLEGCGVRVRDEGHGIRLRVMVAVRDVSLHAARVSLCVLLWECLKDVFIT